MWGLKEDFSFRLDSGSYSAIYIRKKGELVPSFGAFFGNFFQVKLTSYKEKAERGNPNSHLEEESEAVIFRFEARARE